MSMHDTYGNRDVVKCKAKTADGHSGPIGRHMSMLRTMLIQMVLVVDMYLLATCILGWVRIRRDIWVLLWQILVMPKMGHTHKRYQ